MGGITANRNLAHVFKDQGGYRASAFANMAGSCRNSGMKPDLLCLIAG